MHHSSLICAWFYTYMVHLWIASDQPSHQTMATPYHRTYLLLSPFPSTSLFSIQRDGDYRINFNSKNQLYARFKKKWCQPTTPLIPKCSVHPFWPVHYCVDHIGHPHTTSSLHLALYPLLCVYGIFKAVLSCKIAVLINEFLGSIGGRRCNAGDATAISWQDRIEERWEWMRWVACHFSISH